MLPFRVNAADPSLVQAGRVGFSVNLDKVGGLPVIDYVAAMGPAAEAGVQIGDEIVAIDDVPTAGLSIAQINHSLRGPIDTTVRLTLRRDGLTELKLSVVRRSFLVAFGPAAAAGDPVAQYQHGLYYEHRPDEKQALSTAVEWYRKAAEGNYAPAQVKLGDSLAEGRGVTTNLPEAIQWYQQAAEQGDAPAERKLGICYLNGNGVPQDFQSAFKWLEQSASQDDPIAQEQLAYLYREGRGVARDDRSAFAWYYRSAQQDNAFAETNLAYLYSAGRGTARNYLMAFDWDYRAAILDDPYGQWGLASLYSSGRGVKRDRAEALKWYRKAEAALPDNQVLEEEMARVNLGAFLTDPGTISTFDPSTLPRSLKGWLVKIFLILAAFYLLGGILLLRLTFRAGTAPVKLPVALGWIVFLAESQGAAMAGLFLFATTIGANTLLAGISALGALPVILSSGGPARFRFWKRPVVPPRTLWLYGLAALVTMYLVNIGYFAAYTWIMRGQPPGQPTLPLLTKAAAASVWVTYTSAAFLMPVAEEVIFRGYLFDAVRRYCSDCYVIIITALTFAAVHLQSVYFIPIAGFGLILGWARFKTDSIWLPVLLHMLNNGLSLFFYLR